LGGDFEADVGLDVGESGKSVGEVADEFEVLWEFVVCLQYLNV
jgi:hypothetical protein